MAGPSHVFDPLEVVGLALRVAAPVLPGQLHHLLLVVLPHELADDLLGDVPADVLVVVALALHLLLLDLAEDAEPARLFVRAIAIVGLAVRVAEDDVVGDSERGQLEDQGSVSVGDFVEVW